MVQRSAKEEDSLVSQRKEYEKVLAQQRQLYEEKMTELDKLHSQRKVSELPLSPVLCSMCDVYTSQEYEAELEMLQEQKKTYEEKMEEYEALQLQKKVKMRLFFLILYFRAAFPYLSALHLFAPSSQDYEAKLSELESALVKEIQSERTASEKKLEMQRKVRRAVESIRTH